MVVTIETVMAKFLEGKAEIARREKELADELTELKAFQAARLKFIEAELDKAGLQNASVKGVGTAFFKREESVTIDNFDAFQQYIKEQNRDDLLNKSANKTAVLEVMGEVNSNGGRPNPVPPGIKYSSFRLLHIRKG